MINKEFLKSALQDIGLLADTLQTQILSDFYDMVCASNKEFNLTAITAESDFVFKHFIDSLSALDFIPDNSELLDIGSGAGFPAVPIAVMRQDVKVTALDSTSKKVRFINTAAQNLELANLTAVAGRAEESDSLFGKFGVVTARAVSALPVLLELAAPMLTVGGTFIAYKTDYSEIFTSSNAMKTLNMSLTTYRSFILPNGDNRTLLIFEKIARTPKEFPRRYGIIKKNPL